MAERGNSTHGRRMDEEMKHESHNLTRNAVPGHTQEWRQPEPLADDTDSAEVQEVMGASPDTVEYTAQPDGDE